MLQQSSFGARRASALPLWGHSHDCPPNTRVSGWWWKWGAMGWSSLTPAETMSGSLVHPSARPQRKMVLENARRALVTILATCKYVMPLDLWAGDGHPAVCLSKSQAGTAGHDPPTPALLRTPAAARDSSGLRAPSGAWGPPLGPEDTNSALWKEGRGDQHCQQLSTCTALHRGSASSVTP